MTTGVATSAVANGWLNAIRASGTTFTVVAGTYVQLHTADPGAAGTTAVSVGSTTRVAATQSTASAGSITLTNSPSWTNGGTSETITHISVWTASSAGTFLYSAPLSASQAWVNTNSFTLTGLTVAVTPLAA